jgi:hypothetical protein
VEVESKNLNNNHEADQDFSNHLLEKKEDLAILDNENENENQKEDF